jgi:4-hydroxy-2-oxoglutarate aldolase
VKLQGILPALTSSFDYEGKLYKAKVFHNIERLNQIALNGYLVGGSTGETPLLSIGERMQLMEWVREASTEGKILIAGVGCESVQETVALANRAAEIGYNFALALTPYYYRIQMQRPETQALFFRSVADRSKIPVLIYNIPQITGYDVPVPTLAALSEHPNIAGMKDSSGNLERLKEVVPAVKSGFQVMWGSSTNIWEALQSRASGGILALANAVPYACVTIWEAFRTREHQAGADWQARIAGASRLIATKHGVPGLKHAMDLNGYYGGPPRLPLIPPSPESKAEIETAFADLKS